MRYCFLSIIAIAATPTLVFAADQSWMPRDDCAVAPRGDKGLIPEAYDALEAEGGSHRITQTINASTAPSNVHGRDASIDGVDYTAAVDLSVRCLDLDDIKAFLSVLAANGFVAWYRKAGEDEWPKNQPNHIHAVWAREPLKPRLRKQVESWLDGKTGLRKDGAYSFWQADDATRQSLRVAFDASRPKPQTSDQ